MLKLHDHIPSTRQRRSGPGSGRLLPRWLVIAIVLCALHAATEDAAAQTRFGHAGRHFLIPFPDTVGDNVPLRTPVPAPDARLIIFSERTAHVTITAPLFRRDVTVSPGASTTVRLIDGSPSRQTVFLTEPKAATRDIFEITSDEPVIVYCYFMTMSGSEAYAPLPVEQWGKIYTLTSYRTTSVIRRSDPSEEDYVGRPAPVQVILVGAEDGTTVKLTPGIFAAAKMPLFVPLNAGQALLLNGLSSSANYTDNEDITGTVVTSDKPIGILSGTTRSSLAPDQPVITGNTAKNVLAEWLPPLEWYGQSFVYRPIGGQGVAASDEQIRFTAPVQGSVAYVIPRSPKTGPARMGQTEFVAFRTAQASPDGVPIPLSLSTTVPTQAMLITGDRYVIEGSFDPRTSGTVRTTGSAMAELFPRERWLSHGRFNVPGYPTFVRDKLMVVADSGAIVTLDGVPIPFPHLPGEDGDYQQALIDVTPGDHELRATLGRFAAIVYGAATGYEAVRTAGTRKGGESPSLFGAAAGKDRDRSQLLHPTAYDELPSYTYAYPVVSPDDSVTTPTDPAELSVTTRADCDSMVATIAFTDTVAPATDLRFQTPDLRNVALRIDTLHGAGGRIIGFRVTFRPIDPSLNGGASLVLLDAAGGRRAIPYIYNANRLQVSPNPVDLTNVPPSAERLVTIVVRNANDYPVQVTSASLLSGFRGFRIKAPNPFPRILAPGDSAVVTLTFMRVDYDAAFSDALVLAVDCHNDTIPLKARTGNRPAPYLGGHDWGNSWLVASAPCTKNPTDGYPFVVDLYANGTQSVVVASLELIGADAGSFELDRSDPMLSVRTGDILSAGDTNRYRYHQRVIFRPNEERSYRCVLRLITTAGDTVESLLEGVGIESHLTVGDYTFPAVDLTNALAQRGTVTIAARPTRATRIEDLRLVGSGAGRYWLDVADSARLPVVLLPGEIWQVGVWYLPVAPGIDSALLVAIGDESRCDDSTGLLVGSAFRVAVRMEDLDLGSRLACLEDSVTVHLFNDGPDTIRLIGLTVAPDGTLDLDAPTLPLLVPPGSACALVLHVGDRPAGTLDAIIEARGEDTRSGTVIGARGHIVGRFVDGLIEVRGGRNGRAFPGAPIGLPIELTRVEPASGVPTGPITLRVGYNGTILQLLNGEDCAGLFSGTVFDGWRCRMLVSRAGLFEATLDPPPSAPGVVRAGRAANLHFGTFVGDSTVSEITVELAPESALSCLTVEAHPGRAQLDSVCGLGFRLMRLGAARYALEGNRPNPVTSVTDIDFSIGLDGPVRLDVHDASGRQVARLVDADLPAGSYSVRWDASAAGSGLYFYRLNAGTWSAVGSMLLVK